MTVDKQKLLNKIKALIALSESTPYEAEKAAFWDKANKLIEQYHLELSEVMAAGDDENETLKITHRLHRFCQSAPEVKDWKIALGASVGRFVEVKVYLVNPLFFMIVGRELDLDLWKQLYESVVHQIEAMRERDIEKAKAAGRVGMKKGTHPRTWRQLYSTAAARAVQVRIQQLIRIRAHRQSSIEAADRILNAGSQTAIVSVTEKTAEMIAEYMQEQFKGDGSDRVYTPNTVEMSDPSAVLLGSLAGSKVKIQEGLTSGSKGLKDSE